MKRKTHAPKDGYDFGSKAQYRRTIWNFLESFWHDVPIKKRSVFLLDTAKCHETEFLIARGYLPKNIHVCNINAAHVAHVSRRLQSLHAQSVNTYGVDIVRAFERAQNAQQIHMINADLTGQISDKLDRTIEDLRDVFPNKVAFAITTMRGRESKKLGVQIRSALKMFGEREQKRFSEDLVSSGGVVMTPLDALRAWRTEIVLRGGYSLGAYENSIHSHKRAIGTYYSTAGNLTMIWYAFHLERNEHRFKTQIAYCEATLCRLQSTTFDMTKSENINKKFKIETEINAELSKMRERLHALENSQQVSIPQDLWIHIAQCQACDAFSPCSEATLLLTKQR